jgi:hypothetical protein
MKNIEVEQKGNTLTLKIDLTKTFGPSKSGKTIIIASTEGNAKVGEIKGGGPVIVGLNVYTKAAAE